MFAREVVGCVEEVSVRWMGRGAVGGEIRFVWSCAIIVTGGGLRYGREEIE